MPQDERSRADGDGPGVRGPAVQCRGRPARWGRLLGLVLVPLFTGCDTPTDPVGGVAEVVVTPGAATLTFSGETASLTATALDGEGNPLEEAGFTWSSSDTDVATVSGSGRTATVTARAQGTAVITASLPGASGDGVVTVAPAVNAIEVTPDPLELTLGTPGALTAVATDAGGGVIPGVAFEWRSSNAAIATVDDRGIVTGIAPGEVTVTASAGGREGEATVIVEGGTPPQDHSFTTAGNTQLAGGGSVPSTPHISTAGNLLTGTPSLTAVAETVATSNGGSATVEADGDFLYTPAPGDRGPDSFQYSTTTGGTATVTITIRQMVWYVDNTAGIGTGTGVSSDPFGSLGNAVARSSPGDIIFVAAGDGTTRGYDTRVVLEDDQSLIGEGVGLTLSEFGNVVPPGATPSITSTTGTSIRIASRDRVAGLRVLQPVTDGISGTNVSDVVLENVEIQGAGGIGLRLVDVAGTVAFTGLTVANSAGFENAVIRNSSGTLDLTVTGSTFEKEAPGSGTKGLNVFLNGSAQGVATVSSSSFRNNRDALLVGADGQSSLEFTATDNVFTGNEFGISVANGSDATIDYDVSGNTLIGTGIVFGTYGGGAAEPTSSAVHRGRVVSNTIMGSTGQALGGLFAGGVDAQVLVRGNQITGTDNVALLQGGNMPTDDLRLDVTIIDNSVTLDSGSFLRGIQVNALFSNTVCANIQGNTITGSGAGIEFWQRDTSTMMLERLNGGAGTVTSPSVVASHIASENGGAVVSARVATGVLGVPGGTCRTP